MKNLFFNLLIIAGLVILLSGASSYEADGGGVITMLSGGILMWYGYEKSGQTAGEDI